MKPKTVIGVHWLVGYLGGLAIGYAMGINSVWGVGSMIFLMFLAMIYLKEYREEIHQYSRRVDAAKRLCEVYFNMLSKYITEDMIREIRDKAIDKEIEEKGRV